MDLFGQNDACGLLLECCIIQMSYLIEAMGLCVAGVLVKLLKESQALMSVQGVNKSIEHFYRIHSSHANDRSLGTQMSNRNYN